MVISPNSTTSWWPNTQVWAWEEEAFLNKPTQGPWESGCVCVVMALLIKTSSRLHLDNTMICMSMKYLWTRSSVLSDSRASLTWRWLLLRLKYWQQCKWTYVQRWIFLFIDPWLACFLTLHRKTYVVWSRCQLVTTSISSVSSI